MNLSVSNADSKVILAIRRAEHLKRLVYVACNAKAAMSNFVEWVVKLYFRWTYYLFGLDWASAIRPAVELISSPRHQSMFLNINHNIKKTEKKTCCCSRAPPTGRNWHLTDQSGHKEGSRLMGQKPKLLLFKFWPLTLAQITCLIPAVWNLSQKSFI